MFPSFFVSSPQFTYFPFKLNFVKIRGANDYVRDEWKPEAS
ncbi:hypothetical protein GYO_3160 [Bacillus spizizenii TU-B-10]|uniref:Uncharacterized protein n=1 Tax=Bacillus spizizenii (strain DSM 15029 / JCM 12233 / NBRC 101239 / NRRL B-23049 / TU-B-10) TaxID=1052585 RepID=G4NZ65_BACS4|nr:hypothetical protein GYO_3160 [Bacillus spizizenii TU-B-10]SCV43177.1 hypothetical protein BQ1740_3421 [Bacillus subtilis]